MPRMVIAYWTACGKRRGATRSERNELRRAWPSRRAIMPDSARRPCPRATGDPLRTVGGPHPLARGPPRLRSTRCSGSIPSVLSDTGIGPS